jgi:hypothetical protein
MKRGIIFLVVIISLISLASAEIIFTQPLGSDYNLGDSISIPITIKTLSDVSGIFQMNLICNGTETNFYMTGIKLKSGEEMSLVDPNLILIRKIIGGNAGECRVKAILNSAYILSDSFKISDILSIAGTLDKAEAGAGEGVGISGKVTRKTGDNSDGFIEATLLTGAVNSTDNLNQEITQVGTISDGDFSINLSLPTDLKSGNYFINVKAYEKDSDGFVTNNGIAQYSVYVKQVPTNLELVLDETEIMPGSSVNINAILHDQTGESINSTAYVTIKDSADKIIDEKEINLGEIFTIPIRTIQPPEDWTVYAESNGLNAVASFRIKENMEADIQIINKTIVVTNVGNVFYNRTLLVRVGDSPLNIQVELKIGESKRYVVNAPDGEYNVKISEGDKEINDVMSLTGKTIEIKEASTFSWGMFFWILLIGVLGFIAFFFFNKLYKKPFFEKIIHGRRKKEKGKFQAMAIGENMKMTPKLGNEAELSLSMKEGEKQEASVICLKIKDLKEMESRKSRVSETIEKIREIAESSKAVVYENQDYLFFILAPERTKTVKNEKTALDVAEKIKNILEEHNRSFNQRIEFGISINYGSIVGKQEGDVFRFMSMGSLITASKKVAYLSEGEILLSDKVNDLLRLYIKTEKSVRSGTTVFSIKEVKKEVDDATKKFINRFMERQKRG